MTDADGEAWRVNGLRQRVVVAVNTAVIAVFLWLVDWLWQQLLIFVGLFGRGGLNDDVLLALTAILLTVLLIERRRRGRFEHGFSSVALRK